MVKSIFLQTDIFCVAIQKTKARWKAFEKLKQSLNTRLLFVSQKLRPKILPYIF